MRLLFVCNEYPPEPFGGFGTFAKEITHQLAAMGHQVYVYGWYDSVSERTTYKDGEVTVIKDAKPNGGNAISNLRKFGKNVNRITKENNIEAVEINDAGALFLFVKHPKLFVRLHNTERYVKKRGRLLEMLEKASFRFKKVRIIAVSHFIKNQFTTYFSAIHPGSKIYVVYNGIDTNQVTAEKSTKNIVFGGTLKPIKGIDILILAFYESNLWKEGYVLNIYGKDVEYQGRSYKAQLLEIAVDKGAEFEKAVNLLGPVPKKDLMIKFAESFVSVFPSKLESFGLVVVESMLQGSVTIFTNQGAATGFIDHGENGFLFEVDNSGQLAELLTEIRGMDQSRINNIREAAKERAAQFSMDKCADDTLKLYQQ